MYYVLLLLYTKSIKKPIHLKKSLTMYNNLCTITRSKNNCKSV